MEKWLPVVGYEGRYEVSDQGRVRSCPIPVNLPGVRPFVHPMSNRILRQTTAPRNYRQVMLHTGVKSERRTVRVHRLVCEAFHGPAPDGKPHVLHGDGDPSNNTVANLRWGTHEENIREAARHGSIKSGETHPRVKLSDKDVENIRRLRERGISYKEIASRFGVHWCYVQKLVLRTMRA